MIMEGRRSLGGKAQRKPLAECTNTVSRRTSSAAALLKFANPNLTSSLKRILDLTKKPEDANNLPKATTGISLSSTVRSLTRRTTADPGFPAASPSHGVSEKEVVEPHSVYTVRRKASGIKRTRDASSSSGAVRLDMKKTIRENESKLKPLKVAPKKRQRKVKDEEGYGVSQDYIEQQRAYFAEVDAFELAEEEVSSSDLD